MSGIRKNFYNSIPKLFKAFFNEQEIIEAISNNDPFGYEKTDVVKPFGDDGLGGPRPEICAGGYGLYPAQCTGV